MDRMISSTKLPVIDKGFDGQTPFVTAAMCIFGEARGQSYQLKKAVANVIRNRAEILVARGKVSEFEQAIKYAVLKPFQFSCFLKDDPNREKLLAPLKYEEEEVWENCLEAVRDVFVLRTPTNVGAATHYYAASMKVPPKWAAGGTLVATIDGTKFFENVRW